MHFEGSFHSWHHHNHSSTYIPAPVQPWGGAGLESAGPCPSAPSLLPSAFTPVHPLTLCLAVTEYSTLVLLPTSSQVTAGFLLFFAALPSFWAWDTNYHPAVLTHGTQRCDWRLSVPQDLRWNTLNRSHSSSAHAQETWVQKATSAQMGSLEADAIPALISPVNWPSCWTETNYHGAMCSAREGYF